MASRDRLVEQVLEHLQLIGGEFERLTAVAAAAVSLNRTDLGAIQALRSTGGMTAGDLARALRITSGATTRVIDSLVEAGLAVRELDPTDRRRVLVRATPQAGLAMEAAFQRLTERARALLAGYGDAELATLDRFLVEAAELLRTHGQRPGSAVRRARRRRRLAPRPRLDAHPGDGAGPRLDAP